MDYRAICLSIMTSLFLALWILIHFRGYNKLLSKVFNIFVLNMVLWSFGLTMFHVSDLRHALFWSDFLYMAGGLIPPAFLLYSFVVPHQSLALSPCKIFLLFLPNLILLYLFFFTPLMIKEIAIINGVRTFVYGPFHFLWDLNFNAFFLSAFFRFIRLFKKAHGLMREHLKYIIVGTFTGYLLAGITNVIMPLFANCSLIWLGPPLTSTWLAFISYTIIKHRILDIRVVLARSIILFFVYVFVLGLPFLVGYKLIGKNGLWMVPMFLMGILTTAGPFIYFYFQRRAESRLFEDQRRYQDTLRRASLRMGRVKNLKRLLNLTVYIIKRTVRLDHCSIYLFHQEASQYLLRASKGREFDRNPKSRVLADDSALVRYLRQIKEPTVYDEIKQRAQDFQDKQLGAVEGVMRDLHAALAVPSFMEGHLFAIIILGKKRSGKLYSQDDLMVFASLASHMALAIEDCRYWEAETKRLETEGLKERMVSLDHMASSMAHEIDNPMHIISQSLSFARFLLASDPRAAALAADVKGDIEESITRSLSAGERVSAMIRAILDYAKMGTGQLTPIRIKDALDGFIQLISPQIKAERAQFEVDIQEGLPFILGDRIQLEEIFMNFVRNSLHAVKGREKKRIILRIFRKDAKTVRIECADNGYGIEKNFLSDMFLSSTTTKGSSEGTGLGLYRVRKIVDAFGGKVWGESEGKDKGATLIVEVPVYEGDKIAGIDIKKSQQGEADG